METHNIQLSKWWRTKSARAAFRRVEKAKKQKLKKLRAGRKKPSLYTVKYR